MEKNLAFISYRRDDEGPSARFIKAELERYFGAGQVFMDVDNIRGADNWMNAIDENLQNATVVIAVIGRNWLKIQDEFFRRRIDDEKDWVRREIEFALEKKITLVPFLIGCKMPVEEALPESLKAMAATQALSLSAANWRNDMAKLFDLMKSNGFLVNQAALPMPVPVKDMLFPGPLTINQVNEELKDFSGWKIVDYFSRDIIPQAGVAIEKTFEFESFKKAIEFINFTAKHISKVKHHPEWENIWRSVRVRLSTWDIGHKITSLDISLAKFMEAAYSEKNQST
jgi:pterin-4a-carbinolamine dehydratase